MSAGVETTKQRRKHARKHARKQSRRWAGAEVLKQRQMRRLAAQMNAEHERQRAVLLSMNARGGQVDSLSQLARELGMDDLIGPDFEAALSRYGDHCLIQTLKKQLARQWFA